MRFTIKSLERLASVAAFLWKRMKEEGFPVTSETKAPDMDETKDVKAVLDAAGGGRGLVKC